MATKSMSRRATSPRIRPRNSLSRSSILGGSTFSVEITWEPVTFGSTPTLVDVIDDLTEHESESRLRTALDHPLLTQLSHELRNALAPLHYSLEVLNHSEQGSTEAIRSRSAIAQQVDELS